MLSLKYDEIAAVNEWLQEAIPTLVPPNQTNELRIGFSATETINQLIQHLNSQNCHFFEGLEKLSIDCDLVEKGIIDSLRILKKCKGLKYLSFKNLEVQRITAKSVVEKLSAILHRNNHCEHVEFDNLNIDSFHLTNVLTSLLDKPVKIMKLHLAEITHVRKDCKFLRALSQFKFLENIEFNTRTSTYGKHMLNTLSKIKTLHSVTIHLESILYDEFEDSILEFISASDDNLEKITVIDNAKKKIIIYAETTKYNAFIKQISNEPFDSNNEIPKDNALVSLTNRNSQSVTFNYDDIIDNTIAKLFSSSQEENHPHEIRCEFHGYTAENKFYSTLLAKKNNYEKMETLILLNDFVSDEQYEQILSIINEAKALKEIHLNTPQHKLNGFIRALSECHQIKNCYLNIFETKVTEQVNESLVEFIKNNPSLAKLTICSEDHPKTSQFTLEFDSDDFLKLQSRNTSINMSELILAIFNSNQTRVNPVTKLGIHTTSIRSNKKQNKKVINTIKQLTNDNAICQIMITDEADWNFARNGSIEENLCKLKAFLLSIMDSVNGSKYFRSIDLLLSRIGEEDSDFITFEDNIIEHLQKNKFQTIDIFTYDSYHLKAKARLIELLNSYNDIRYRTRELNRDIHRTQRDYNSVFANMIKKCSDTLISLQQRINNLNTSLHEKKQQLFDDFFDKSSEKCEEWYQNQICQLEALILEWQNSAVDIGLMIYQHICHSKLGSISNRHFFLLMISNMIDSTHPLSQHALSQLAQQLYSEISSIQQTSLARAEKSKLLQETIILIFALYSFIHDEHVMDECCLDLHLNTLLSIYGEHSDDTGHIISNSHLTKDSLGNFSWPEIITTHADFLEYKKQIIVHHAVNEKPLNWNERFEDFTSRIKKLSKIIDETANGLIDNTITDSFTDNDSDDDNMDKFVEWLVNNDSKKRKNSQSANSPLLIQSLWSSPRAKRSKINPESPKTISHLLDLDEDSDEDREDKYQASM